MKTDKFAVRAFDLPEGVEVDINIRWKGVTQVTEKATLTRESSGLEFVYLVSDEE